MKEYMREWHKKYPNANKQWYEAHKEEKKIKSKEWKINNPEKQKIYYKRWYEKSKQEAI